ncbi:MAG: hypothetical protein GXP08_18760 [Gammaproteobacteria bacterium]|nr:hypothetical protein [Gammaproteobacteria bacterium]
MDVELLDSLGRVLESGTKRLLAWSGTAKHDHKRDFSIALLLPEVKEFSVRVQHSIGGADTPRRWRA